METATLKHFRITAIAVALVPLREKPTGSANSSAMNLELVSDDPYLSVRYDLRRSAKAPMERSAK
jgi:hypothetical protein